MSRSDAEFRQYVCDSLRAQEKEIAELKELTTEIAELVEMGRSLFIFAKYIGAAMKWVGTVATGAFVLWQIFSGKIENLFK